MHLRLQSHCCSASSAPADHARQVIQHPNAKGFNFNFPTMEATLIKGSIQIRALQNFIAVLQLQHLQSQGKTEPWFHSGCTCNPCITFLAKSLPAPVPAFLSGCHRNNKRRLANCRSSLDKPWSCFTSMVTKAEIASWKTWFTVWRHGIKFYNDFHNFNVKNSGGLSICFFFLGGQILL